MDNTAKIVWIKDGIIFRQAEDKIQIIDKLPKKIYNLIYDADRHDIYLEEFADEFVFNFKVYGLESNLVNHIVKTFENTSSNLGVLFNGTKGTGKTITAKIIANRINLPVIIINTPCFGLSEFISKIQCPCILFFDEFEKNFNTEKGVDLQLLSLMDGIYNSPYRKVFLLTTNKLSINDNLIGRPSRIRYKKSFNNLPYEVVMEYLEDNLLDKKYIPEIIEFIDTLAISTIDILKSIVEEINIHRGSFSDYKNYLNVETAEYVYSLFNFGNITVPEAKEKLTKVGSVNYDSDGDEYIVSEIDLDIYTQRLGISTPIYLLKEGDIIPSYGTVITPVDNDGFIRVQDRYSKEFLLQVRNLSNKPSLYKTNLIY